MADEKLITERGADAAFAALVGSSMSQTRAAILAALPKTAGAASTSLAQYVWQNSTGTWPNPVRDSNVAGRMYVGLAVATPPTAANGLRAGDMWVSREGTRVASSVPAVGSPVWVAVAGPGTGTPTTPTDPGTPTTPTDPGPTTPPPTETPVATSRPRSVTAIDGVWSTTGGTTLAQALSDQHLTGASAVPAAGESGVGLTLGMQAFAFTPGDNVTVTLWGATTSTPGAVTVGIVNSDGVQFVAPKTMQISATETSPAFTWAAADQLQVTAEQWRGAVVRLSRATGGFTKLMDITMQSTPPPVNPGPVDSLSPASITWANNAVWTSQIGSAPAAKASVAQVAYLRAQTSTLRLDCLPGGDAPPMWMVPATAQRINVTPRSTSTLMVSSDGKGAMQGVPLPATAGTPGNMFRTAAVGCVETQQVWELIGLAKDAATGAWSADWAGRIDGTTTNGGVMPVGTGYTGSGLSYVAAAVKVSEARAAAAGQIEAISHAIGLNLNYETASTAWAWPATRSDGKSGDVGAPRMGQRFRLKSSFNVAASTLTPIAKAVARAAQVYGLIVMGGSERPSILCESGAVEQARTGIDPWAAILGGRTIDTVLSGIPLDQFEAISPGWGGPNWKPEEDPVTTTPVTPPPTTPPATGSAAMRILGPTRSGLPWHSGVKAQGPYSTAMVEKFGQWRGRPVDGGLTYPNYSGQGGTATSQDIRNSGWTASLYNGFPGRIYYGMPPFAKGTYGSQRNWDARLWAQLAAGHTDHDSVIDAQASYLANQGRGNSIIRIAWEWNGDWYTWRAGSAGVAHFKAGFRRIVNRFRAKSSQFKFCFEVNAGTPLYGKPGTAVLTDAYPGDDVVDLVGIDIYQFKSESTTGTADFSGWLRARPGRGVALNDVADFARSRGKGMAIMEWGIHGTSGYGDDPNWIQGMWNWLVANQDVVACEAYFNEADPYIANCLYNSENGSTAQNPRAAAKYKELWGRGV